MKALIFVVLVACSSDASQGSTDGPKVFETMCAACHGPKGQPPEAMVVRLGVRDLTAPELRARVTPELVEKQVRTGSANKLMPSFQGAHTDAQIKAVAAYVASPAFVK
jgi:mono/diheme cytochrome c family protein